MAIVSCFCSDLETAKRREIVKSMLDNGAQYAVHGGKLYSMSNMGETIDGLIFLVSCWLAGLEDPATKDELFCVLLRYKSK